MRAGGFSGLHPRTSSPGPLQSNSMDSSFQAASLNTSTSWLAPSPEQHGAMQVPWVCKPLMPGRTAQLLNDKQATLTHSLGPVLT